jgi:hypothetical protein
MIKSWICGILALKCHPTARTVFLVEASWMHKACRSREIVGMSDEEMRWCDS